MPGEIETFRAARILAVEAASKPAMPTTRSAHDDASAQDDARGQDRAGADALDLDTRLVARGDGRYGLERPIDADWWVVNGPNGGFIAALMLRAMNETVGDEARVPRSLTVHYTSPPAEGDADIETEVLRSGRSLSSVTSRLSQGGKLRAFAVAAISAPRNGTDYADLQMPECLPANALDRLDGPLAIHRRYDMRFLPGQERNAASDHARTAAWIRLAEPGRPLDATLLAAYADALPPAVFALAGGMDRFGPVPTIDLTVHFRNPHLWVDIGPEDHCLALFRTRLADSGFIEEDGEIWSPDGHLLALSRQLAIGLK